MAREPTGVPLMAVGSLRAFNCPGRLLIAQDSCQPAEGRGTAHQKKQTCDFARHFDPEPPHRFHDERQRTHDGKKSHDDWWV